MPRPAAERIPLTTSVIDITSGVEAQPAVESLSVTNRSDVRKIVTLINGLPIAQPIVYACPMLTDPRIITMTFRTVAGGPALAVLTYDDFRPWPGPSEACKTVDLTIAGRRQDALTGGSFVLAIGRILDTPLT